VNTLTPARRGVAAVACLVSLAAGGYILFWTIGFLSFFLPFFLFERFPPWYPSSGGLGAVSAGVSEALVELVVGLPFAVVVNRLLRHWARSRGGRRRTLHRLHSWLLFLVFPLFVVAVAAPTPVFNDRVWSLSLGLILGSLSSVVYGVQFLLIGSLLGMYAAAPDPKAGQP
jgi:hypothetical protein